MFKFNNVENKSLVWELLYKNHIFDNIDDSYTNNIKQLIDNTIIEISNNNEYKNHTVLELNKILISRITSSINTFKNQNNNNNINKDYNNIKKDYNSVLMNNAETMKLEMNKILQVKKPPEPVFKDNQVDKYNNINIDNELQKLINERNKYQNVTPDINREMVEQQQQQQQSKDTVNDNITLVYDKTTTNEQIKNQNLVGKSKVENIEDIFTDNISTTNNKPQPHQDNREKIIELLYDIQKKQNMIINIFNNIP